MWQLSFQKINISFVEGIDESNKLDKSIELRFRDIKAEDYFHLEKQRRDDYVLNI